MNGDVKIGKLLCDEDIITKRQLNQALQLQLKGDKRTLGEILVDRGFCTLNDITEVIMRTTNGHEERQKEIVEKIEGPKEKQPIDISENVVMKTKFALDVKTMISAAVGIASLVGMWYALQADIQEAKELPSLESWYSAEYPSRPEGYNWPRSYEQYKDNVEGLQEEMDAVYEVLDEYEEAIEELEKIVTELRVQVANKRDK